jgi:LysM repeat protein
MTRPAPAVRRRRAPGGRASLGALVALALVTTAGAPSIITVRPGDTLWELARTHGTSERALQALNDLPGNGMIYAGQTLRISDGGSAAPAASARSHRVASGETLSHLALRYGVSASSIASANGVSGGRIYAGSTLSIPGGSGDGSTSTSEVPTTNAGVRIPETVRSSVAENRRVLAGRSHPAKAEVRQMVAATARRHGVSPRSRSPSPTSPGRSAGRRAPAVGLEQRVDQDKALPRHAGESSSRVSATSPSRNSSTLDILVPLWSQSVTRA